MPTWRKYRTARDQSLTRLSRWLDARGASTWLRRRQSGQSAVLFALAMLAMLSMASLAIDTGNLYLQRRRAQHAADAAALAGATNWQGVMPNVSLKPAEAIRDARRLPVSNGFATDPSAGEGTDQEVTVYVPRTEPWKDRPDHIEVTIRRDVPSLFAKVLGLDEFRVTARAVARSKQNSFDAATISFDEGPQSTKFQGSSSHIYVDGNIYSRGGIKQQSASTYVDVSGDVFARQGISGGGGIHADEIVTGEDNVPYLLDPQWPLPYPLPTNPNVSWQNNFSPGGDGNAYIDAGRYKSIKITSGGAPTIFCTGVYYVTGNQGVSINGAAKSVPPSHTKPDGSPCGGPVMFVLTNNASFEAQSQSQVYFETSADPPYNNILIHSAHCGNAVKLAGGNDFQFVGTIYAPCGDVQLTGTSKGTVQGQVVANTVTVAGGAGPGVQYHADRVPEIPGPSLVE